MSDENSTGPPAQPGQHRFAVGERVAWTEGRNREAGEGVVAALVPPTAQDGQPRYRIRVFVDGRQSEGEVVLVEGVLFEVPRWALHMRREERLRFHQGATPPWNEEIGSG